MKQTFPETYFEIACLLIDTAISIYRQTHKESEVCVCRCSVKRAVMQLQEYKSTDYARITFFNNAQSIHIFVNLSFVQKQFNQ